MAWFAYLIGIILMSADMWSGGILVFMVGMMYHWKYWIPGLLAFFIAAGWKKPI